MNLQGRVAVITGGAVRIGRALALGCAEQDMRICMHYGSSSEAAERTAREIRQSGREAITVQADLSDAWDAAGTVFDAALSQFGRIDVLINNAAIFEAGTLDSLTPENWDRHMAINLTAPTVLCQQFARVSAQHGKGQGAIINLADWRALQPQPGHLAYTISKAGLVALTRLLALELSPGIRVNAIAPGAILPPAGADDHHVEKMSSVIPLKHTGCTEDIVSAALYLLRSEFVTGEILHVTGGQQLTVDLPSED